MNTTHWGMNLRKLRLGREWTQAQLADRCGIKRAVLGHYELGFVKKLNHDVLLVFANAFGMTPEKLYQELHGRPMPGARQPETLTPRPPSDVSWPPMMVMRIPVIGTVPAGGIDLREEEASGYIYVPQEVLKGLKKEDLRTLVVDGHCLIGDGINDKDFLVFSTKQTSVVSGKIYICRINEHEVTVKHVYLEDGQVRLRASNPDYPDMVLSSVEILGRVVCRQPPCDPL